MAETATISEQAAADLLSIPRATLRYYRVKGYLPVGLIVEPEPGTFQGRTSPVNYDAAVVAKIAAGEQSLFPPNKPVAGPAITAKPDLHIVPNEPEPDGAK